MAQPMPEPQAEDNSQDGAPDGAAPAQGAKKSPAELLSDINMGLMQLNDLIAQSDAIDPEEKQELGNIIQQFQSFADGLSGAPGKKPGASPAPSQNMPDNGGPGTAPAM